MIVYEIFDFEYSKFGKKTGLKWDISAMKREALRQTAAAKPSFFRVFNPAHNLSKQFFKEVAFRTTGERNLILEVTGPTGSGKSKVAITLALEKMKKSLTVDDIAFTTDQLLQQSMKVGKSHVLIKDEQIDQVGVGSQREGYEQRTLEDTTRKFGLSMIFCSPVTKVHSTAHYNLEVVCINKRKRLTKVAIIGSGGFYMGYFIIKVVSDRHPVWRSYSKKKDEFIDSVLSRSTKRLSLDDLSLSLKKHKFFSAARTREEQKIVCMKMYPTLTVQEIAMIVDNLRMLERLDGV